MPRYRITYTLLIVIFSRLSSLAQVDPSAYVNFEGAQTSPVRLSPDRTRLFAVNTPDARLSVFSLAQPSAPRLIAEIPVGIEPVSVSPRTNDEVWVTNQVSDSISVVSVSRGIVIDTIQAKDEPTDVVFAGNYAFASISRNNQVRVFDGNTRAFVKTIQLQGHNPRALAVNATGNKVYVALALSGNRTTILPITVAPPQPAPTNPALPPPPQAGLIIDALDPAWRSVIRFRLPDNDVAEIDVASLQVTRYFPGVGTINLGLAVRPFTGDLYVANTNGRNLVQFEPNVRGHFVDNRITRIQLLGATTAFDLNPSINYSLLPNPAARATALAQPTAIVFEPLGRWMYVASFGTDRVAVVDANGSVGARIEIGPAGGAAVDPRTKRGPRGLALHADVRRLYVSNRISNTISIVDINTNTVVGEIPVGSFDPTPASIRNGRGFLYDAKLSGNGTGSCAACHVDADMDFLAWNLGDRGGDLLTTVQNGVTFTFHPMKGPKTTQTLRGLKGMTPFHWKGDRENFAAFNPAFDKLMGGTGISTADMNAYMSFIETIQFQPNPLQNLDGTFPPVVAGGDPTAGRNTFLNQTFSPETTSTCNSCHKADPGPGTDNLLEQRAGQEPTKHPHLRNIYQKVVYTNEPGAVSLSGFGLNNDGELTLPQLMTLPRFGVIATDLVRRRNVASYMLCFDTGMPAITGFTLTLTSANVTQPSSTNALALLRSEAALGRAELIVKGTLNSRIRGLLYQPASENFAADQTGVGPFSLAQLTAAIQSGDVLTFMAVPVGSGRRMAIDRNLNGVLDGNEGPVLARKHGSL